MYQVYCDGQLLHDPRLQDFQLLSPSLSLEVNKTGSFTFTQYPDHPMAGLVQKLRSVIAVEKDRAVLFRGRPLSSKEGFYGQQDYTCEGELAFLLDSRVRPFEMAGGVAELFTCLINQHNEQVDAYKQFKVGNVTVTDPNDYINRSNVTYETTFDILKTRLLDTLGGYLWVRHEADGVYLDYLEDFPYMSTQRITFGENLLDYARTRDGSEIATALIPLGARLEDEEGNQTDERLTIAEVNDGKDYVYDEAAVERYGWIFATQTWDDVTQAGNLKQKALDALQEKIKTVDTIEMTAADLSQMNQNFDDFRVGQYVFVDSLPHGMDGEKFLVTKMTLRLDDPSQNKLTFGRVRTSFTEESNKNDQIMGDLVDRTEEVIQNVAGISKKKLYRIYIISTGGDTFKNGEGSTTLQAVVYSWDKEITATLEDSRFQWLRSSQDLEGDAVWNTAHANDGKQIEVTAEDVPGQATFVCRLKDTDAQGQITLTIVQDGKPGQPGKDGQDGQDGKDGEDAAIISPTEPEDKTKLWCDTSGEPPLLKQWDGEKWVVVGDPSDTIQQVYEDVYSIIDQTADEIKMEVSESTYAKGEVDQLLSEMSSTLTQTAEGWEMEFNEFKSWVENTNGENQTAFEELRKYIRFIEGNIELGDQNNDLKCIISNTKISFEQNGAEVAYISNNKLYITNAEVLDRFTVGNPSSGYFDWIPRANGNLGMKWRAG
ncbi:MAG TPA: phage tail protein [Candidatus Gallacutalibacter pullistercoris]|nr:phage tail protein [Candidatus Gallacutalibacter pullistercoris]